MASTKRRRAQPQLLNRAVAAPDRGVVASEGTMLVVADELRKLNAQLAQQAQPLPADITGKAQQAIHAAALQQQSNLLNSVPLNKIPAKMAQPWQPGEPLPNTPQGASPLQSEMETNLQPGPEQVTMFPPGAPLRTVPDLESPQGPRQYDYPVGYNIGAQPRSTEISTAARLRNLALYFYGIQLCELVWFDVANRLQPKVTFDENIIPDGESATDPKWQEIATPAQEFVKCPDGIRTFHDWLTASIRDVLELGYSVIYKQRNLLGQVISLDLVDPALIKPLVDWRGRLPRPPWAAYQQFLYGVPGGTYRADEMVTITDADRTDSPYPFSRVDRILLIVNLALRKQNRDMRRYTDGAVPAGFVSIDTDTGWTPEQVEQYEQDLNDLMAGNDRARARIKVLPPGGSFVGSDPSDPQTDFDRFMLNVAVACFGLTMDEVAFTETSNRSVGDSQENVIYRRVVMPLAVRYADTLTGVVKERFDQRLHVEFAGFEEKEDLLLKAQTLDIAVKGGWISSSFAARQMGYPVEAEVPPWVLVKDGPIFLEDAMVLREAQVDAKKAGLEFAIASPGGVAASAAGPGDDQGGEGDDAQDEGDDKGPPPAGGPKQTPPGQRPTPGKGSKPQGPPTSKKPAAAAAAGGGPRVAARVATVAIEPDEPDELEDEDPPGDSAATKQEYRMWYTLAMRSVQKGQRLLQFERRAIRLEDYMLLAHDLAQAQTPADVKRAFVQAKQREQQPIQRIAFVRAKKRHPHSLGRVSRQQVEEHGQHLGDLRERQNHRLMVEAMRIFEHQMSQGHHQVH